MGKEIHIIQGGAGMGSTVKMVHRLLAGVHIVVAAEALALAAKAGLDVEQMYDIVKGAAGANWMFCDRGQRMIDNPENKIMSTLAIFIKDMDIVYSEAKRLESPIPLASAALQQFISGASLGLAKEDDSQVVKIYESLSGTSVKKTASIPKEGNDIGDIWVLPD
jgi:3-hydroxyisobutyrate dehydrogenase-like beta-hydroxyacid dehydrogenase